MNSVTVIIPAYNAEVCLDRCLHSVFRQSHKAEQIIVVNDGSADNTKAITNKFADRIEYYEHKNQGPGASRNVGLGVARGEYVAFLDSDDYWEPNFLSKCVSFLEGLPRAVAVSTGQINKLWGHGEAVRPLLLQNPDCPKAPFIIDNFFSFWAEHNHIVTGSTVIRRRIIEEAGYQRTDFRMCEDLEYWGYLATFGKWGFIPEALWVGDPMQAAAYQGWLKRYSLRWQNLPTPEQWESRIVRRLGPDDMDGFHRIKRRIAAILVHHNILGGHDEDAKRILIQFGDTVSRSHVIRLLQAGVKGGSVGWSLACKMIRLRERLKAIAIYFSSRRFTCERSLPLKNAL